MRQGADTLKRVHFELGGKNPVIVFDDADLDRALDAVVFMIYSLNGERCTSSSRLLIHSSLQDEFLARLADRVSALKVGHPLDPATEVGPLVHARHFDKVCSYFDRAVKDGAQVAVGGEACDVGGDIGTKGNYVRPTLFTGARNTMRIAQEEIFGPVLTAIPFDSEDEAVAIANDVGLWVGRLRVDQRCRALHAAVTTARRGHAVVQFGEQSPPAGAFRRHEGQRYRA